MIKYDTKKRQFHLSNDRMSYVMEVTEQGYLLHTYYGKKIENFMKTRPYPNGGRSSFSPSPLDYLGSGFSLDTALQEFPGYDSGDYRAGMYEVTFPDWTKASTMKYVSHEIFEGKKKLEGLPATYVNEDNEATTLEILMRDEHRKISAVLSYTLFRDLSVLTKSVRYFNNSTDTVILNKAKSGSIDFDSKNFDMLSLPGTWSREKEYIKAPLSHGIHTVDSKRGASSSHYHPFMALCSKELTEHQGDVYAFHFVYSGNFSITAEVDIFENTRVVVGINDFNFDWLLQAGDSFQTPEVVMVYSSAGLNGMSQQFHALYRNHLVRGIHKHAHRPILINNWETTYFDFNEEKLLNLAKGAKALGVELFVLDDGWFGERNSDTTSLGDWVVNTKKLPSGVKGIAEQVKKSGMKFGLWFEPEMISEKSELFKSHPDWHIHVPSVPSSVGRSQLILDWSRAEVRDHIYSQIKAILDEVPVDYIKWDMNRNMTEMGSTGRAPSAQMETAHRYMLGLYDILDRITTDYPAILFENCSGGGGRFDAGMSYYMPQSWTSDNTDAIARLQMQYTNSFIFPPEMICAQLAEVPNHQTGRLTPIETRAAVAMSVNFGIMLNLQRETAQDLEKVKSYIDWYKQNRDLLQFSTFYRLLNPFEGNSGAWLHLAPDGSRALVTYVQILNRASAPLQRVKLVALDPQGVYDVEGEHMSGDELMSYGLYLNHGMSQDFEARVVEIKKIK